MLWDLYAHKIDTNFIYLT